MEEQTEAAAPVETPAPVAPTAPDEATMALALRIAEAVIFAADRPVSPQTLFGDAARQCERLSQCGLRSMKGGIETGDLSEFGAQLAQRLDCREVVRLRQGGQRRQRIQFGYA